MTTEHETVGDECWNCGGAGYVLDNLGGCGDPECCGGPWKIKCRQCDNNWSAENAE